MKFFILCFVIFIYGWSCFSLSQPWIATSDLKLRADIETLADIGIIKVPISTYPLMWSGIIKNIDYTDINEVADEYKSVLWRVKNAGKKAFSNHKNRQLAFTFSNSEKALRSFGDKQRGKSELRASSSQISKNVAWNIEVSKLLDPSDGDTTIYEGSYLAAIMGNWIASIGYVEKWWGSSWDSANLLSNNARAPLSLSLNRNYTNINGNSIIQWLGNWNFSAFVSQLESERVILKPTFSGMSFSTKLIDSLETSIRFTRLSGGDSESNNLISKNKTVSGIDFRWRIPSSAKLGFPTNLYAGITDEGYKEYSSRIFGVSSFLPAFGNRWRTYLEYTDTSSNDQSELAYADNYYQTGYRFKQRAIGSTYDSQSRGISFGILGNLNRYQSVEIKIQSLEINVPLVDNFALGTGFSIDGFSIDTQNSLSSSSEKIKRVVAKWQLQVNKTNQVNVEFEMSNNVFDTYERQNERYRVQFSWNHYIN